MISTSITDIRVEDGAKAIFFNVLFELGDDLAFALPGWKVVDGKIFPPAKGRGNSYYSVILSSPKFAKLVQEALEASKPEGIELEADAYTSSKWGQSGLRSIYRDSSTAMEIWKKYKGERNVKDIEKSDS